MTTAQRISESIINVTDGDLLDLLVAFAFIDGHLSNEEVTLLKHITSAHGIPDAQLIDKIEQYKSITNHQEICYRALDKIVSPQARKYLVGFLCDIATADGVHHESELKFLNAVHERWGINVSIGRQLKWDSEQEAVVRAGYQERLIVHAGPGMGKTAVACARVSELIDQHVTPSNIWMLSFTRTAVKELRDRIISFSDHAFSSLGIKIATIDSRAWEISYGLSEEKIEQLFGSYEQNLESVLDLFETKQDDIREEFENIEHVIIDEAQDIIGLRAKLLIAILELLNPKCGFTIFADPAQAIYGFTEEDNEEEDSEKGLNFLDMVKQKFASTVKEKELKKIHRTSNPKLVQLIEEMRLDIYVTEAVDKEHFNKRKSFIEAQADHKVEDFHPSELRDDILVLFRRRAEVLQASYHACNDSIPHRIRMSGHTAGLFSWIGYLFCDFPDRRISKERFLELCEAKAGYFADEGKPDCEAWWKLLYDTAGKANHVDLSQLRIKLSRTPAPIHFCYPDLGQKGAILGTIHASKGREANSVILRLPATSSGYDTDFDEESRVLFVGATRAKNDLTVGSGISMASFSQSLDNGRIYRKYGKTASAFIEIGLAGDLDDYSFVSRKRHKEDVVLIQQKLSEFSNRIPYKLKTTRIKENDEYYYRIWTKSGGKEIDRAIGDFSQNLNHDLFRIAENIGARTVPSELNELYMLGLKTVCKPEGDPGLQHIHEPYQSTGFWVVPVIVGNSLSSFSRPSSTRRQ